VTFYVELIAALVSVKLSVTGDTFAT